MKVDKCIFQAEDFPMSKAELLRRLELYSDDAKVFMLASVVLPTSRHAEILKSHFGVPYKESSNG